MYNQYYQNICEILKNVNDLWYEISKLLWYGTLNVLDIEITYDYGQTLVLFIVNMREDFYVS